MIGKALFVFGIVMLALGVTSVFATTKVTYKTVETKGTGENLQETINKALVEAIGRVNGKSIDAANQKIPHPRPCFKNTLFIEHRKRNPLIKQLRLSFF